MFGSVRVRTDPYQALASPVRQAHDPAIALHWHPLVKLGSLPEGQYFFDARYTLQAVKSAAYMSQWVGVLKPHVQCECLWWLMILLLVQMGS